MLKKYTTTLLLFLLFCPILAHAESFDPSTLSLAWGIPFALVLLSIALGPTLMANLWHHHFGKITALWTLCFLVPFGLYFGMNEVIHVTAHAILTEYIPFILLLLALYTVSGGILVWGNLHGCPKTNTIFLAIGTFLASITGTTGAAMLLIRPLLRANDNRKHKVHVVVFFIFLVANIGGGLTPLGDPPLFLGFLKGVSFMWTVEHMLLPVIISSILLLTVFFFLDRRYYAREDEILPNDPSKDSPLHIYGKFNIILLIAIVGAVLLSGVWKPETHFDIFGAHIGLQDIVRDVILLIVTGLSLILTPKQVRAGNEFDWEAMKEVGKLFLGIFITITPVLAMLKVGEAGHFRPLVHLVHTSNGEPINTMYFWMSGLLSAFLDNAPTYLVFFNMASGDAQVLMGSMFHTLLAVSMGSVFMGALSYVGNAPNFMVKSIAERRGVDMPSFFGYMAWSCSVLVPLFIIHTIIFFIL